MVPKHCAIFPTHARTDARARANTQHTPTKTNDLVYWR